MMSADQSQTTLRSKLEALQCHFTWILEPSKINLVLHRDKLVDIGTEDGNSWLGHIYNLRGFIQCKLGSTEDALSFFLQAAEAFGQMRRAGEGPWLVVNYGNLAWLHHLLGDQAESEAYLSKVEAIKKKYPTPSEDELHAELYAEKAWTLMILDIERELVSDYFQKAIQMQPDMVEWNTSHVIGLASNFVRGSTKMEADILDKMRDAKEQDPENLYLAACDIQIRATKRQDVADEARELAKRVSINPVSSYSQMRAILRVYRTCRLIDEAILLAAKAVENNPDQRYLKKFAALTLKWKIVFFSDSGVDERMVDRAVILHKEVISLYPDSAFVEEMDLANIYAKSKHRQDEAKHLYGELLERKLEPAEKQVLYKHYAKHLLFDLKDYNKSIEYNMKAAKIPINSFYRESSIKALVKSKNKGRNPKCREIEEFLENLKKP
uniref:interferon-induced protein with tetratricopeptide repeats 1B-like n=1 Tax=Gasterosteus aculeatus aculeatus TaxID=481459 RepID=UPI001A98D35E|nr:interferon-induced protein with tetratricopeptide repeats 1B-like [Gasterosteus aculeatus aculeatus]